MTTSWSFCRSSIQHCLRCLSRTGTSRLSSCRRACCDTCTTSTELCTTRSPRSIVKTLPSKSVIVYCLIPLVKYTEWWPLYFPSGLVFCYSSHGVLMWLQCNAKYTAICLGTGLEFGTEWLSKYHLTDFVTRGTAKCCETGQGPCFANPRRWSLA